MSLTLYGIPGCDSVKKARRWLDEQGVAYTFHDYKKRGIDADTLSAWCEEFGWEALVNRRGTTWRRLSDSERADLDTASAIALMQQHTSLIKRPMIDGDRGRLLGFDAQRYAAAFAASA